MFLAKRHLLECPYQDTKEAFIEMSLSRRHLLESYPGKIHVHQGKIY